MSIRRRSGAGSAWLLAAAALAAGATPQVDAGFHHPIADPAYPRGGGPSVCIDEAHHNYHTADGLYAPFAELLRDDGYRVAGLADAISAESMAACDVYVVVNPVAAANVDDWSFPHDSAFTHEELAALVAWVRAGGSLLLVVDHAPIPGAMAGLGGVFGVQLLDVEARNDPRAPVPDVFRAQDGTLLPHPITEGRSDAEKVGEVATWTGTAFLAARDYETILAYGPDSLAWVDLSESVDDAPADEWPVYEAEGLAAAAARRWDDGRILVLGEAGMCTALGTEQEPRGMNAPAGKQNAQFCLNGMHWLSALLDTRQQPQ